MKLRRKLVDKLKECEQIGFMTIKGHVNGALQSINDIQGGLQVIEEEIKSTKEGLENWKGKDQQGNSNDKIKLLIEQFANDEKDRERDEL